MLLDLSSAFDVPEDDDEINRLIFLYLISSAGQAASFSSLAFFRMDGLQVEKSPIFQPVTHPFGGNL
jgi:hypothetical protein